MYKILVCDDEKDIVSALRIYLNGDGYEVVEAYSGKEALEKLSDDINLVLMDIMMPEMDGIEAMVKIRERSNVPVILLTAKSEDSDKVLGLNVGADDYITKPFNPLELAARVKSQLRRYMTLGSNVSSQEEDSDIISEGGIEIDDKRKEVKIDGEVVDDFANQHAETFREGLQNILEDIFNPDKPFTCTSDAKTCEYCKLGLICGKGRS
jgi:DNA-binding response OmpR family regulator